MKITFDNWIKNPTGKSSVMTNTQVYRNLYSEKLDKIMVREAGTTNYKLYTDSKTGDYYCYIQIWSEVVPRFYYDVVIQFYTDDPAIKISDNLEKYNVRFFSNDPAFVYTFAHAYAKNDLFITDFTPRMSKLALRDKAKTKNPKDEIGYVKSFFFAYLIMRGRGLFKKVAYKSANLKYDKKILLNYIEPSDSKIMAREEKEQELNKSKKIEEKKQQVRDDNANRSTASNTPSNLIHSVKKTNIIKGSNNINSVKRSHVIKKK